MSAAGLILAAGESRRMGSPKALLDFPRGDVSRSPDAHLRRTIAHPVVVVLGAGADEIRGRLTRAAPVSSSIDDWRTGQTSSMQCGLRAVPPEADGVLFTLVDHPAVAPETIDALLAGGRPLSACPGTRAAAAIRSGSPAT